MRTPYGTGARRAVFSRGAFALGLSLLALCAGCATRGESGAAEPVLVGAPDWVTRGCAGASNRICGVGSAGGMQNSSLRRTAAIGRARTDIARSLQSQVTSMLKDYAATTTGEGDFGLASSDEQHLTDVSKQITNVTLAGTEVMDTWVSPDSTLYALVTLDVEKFADTVNRMTQLSEHVRQAVVERADASFGSEAPPPASE